jgi:hypothetical protein
MSLIAHYKFEQNVLDSSGNNLHGTGSSDTYATGKLGYAMTGGYATVSNTSKLQIVGELTIAFWFKINTYAVRETLIGKAYGGEFTINVEVNPLLRFYAGLAGANTTPYSNFDTTTLTTGVWHHGAIRKWSDGSREWWIDGSLNSSGAAAANFVGSASSLALMLRGGYLGNGEVGTDLDDLYIYDHVLSVREVKELSKAKVLHYTFDDFQEPTTNLYGDITTSTQIRTPNSQYTGPNIPDPNIPYIYEYTSGALSSSWSGNSYGYTYKDLTIDSGKSFIVSTWIWLSEDCDAGSMGDLIEGATSEFTITGYDATYDITKKGTWQRLAKGGVSDGFIRAFGIYIGKIGVTDGSFTGSIRWGGTQVEIKDHPTSYTPSSRSGIISDISGQGNDGSIALATSPEWVSNSALGSGAYNITGTPGVEQTVSIDNDIVLEGDFTVIYRFNPTAWPFRILNYASSTSNTFGHSAAGTLWCSLGSIALSSSFVLNEWNVITITRSGTSVTVYNGINEVGTGTWSGTFTLNKVGGISSGTAWTTYNYIMDDIRIYTTALSSDDVEQLVNTVASIDNEGNFWASEIEEVGYKATNLLNYTTWTVGTNGSQTGFSINGTASENYIIESTDPFGKLVPIWEARPDAASGADGGWVTSQFAVDCGSYYRFSVWVNRTVLGNGHFYLGIYGYNAAGTNIGVLYRRTGVVDTNAYFEINSPNYSKWGTVGEWYLVVAHVFPEGSGTGANHDDTGVYDLTGEKIYPGTHDFVWQPENTTALHRSYLFYSTDTTTRQQWAYPRVDKIDGTEPSVQDLVSGFDSTHYDLIVASNNGYPETPLSVGPSASLNLISEVGPVDGIHTWYPFDGDVLDLSGNGNNGTLVGSPVYLPGVDHQGLELNATSEYISLSSACIPESHQITIAFWAYKYTLNANFVLEVEDALSQRVLSSHILYSNGNTYWDCGNDGDSSFDRIYKANPTDYLNSWHHWAFTKNTITGVMNIYLDGELWHTDTGMTKEFSGFFDTGNIGMDAGLASVAFDGILDDFRIYGRELSAKEVMILHDTYDPDSEVKMKIGNTGIIYISGEFKEGL